MAAFQPTSKKNPCSICGRTKDGDCRTSDKGFVYCHTDLNGVAKGKQHPDKPFVYCGTTEDEMWGIWKPQELCEELPQKEQRKPQRRFFSYKLWDGSDLAVKRRRIDFPDHRPKEVKWAGTLDGLPQTAIAPYQWHDVLTRVELGENLFVVRGELKAELLLKCGFPSISILSIGDRLIAELRRLQRQVVLCPDCDLADLSHWYHELTQQLPDCRHLLSPMKGLNWRQPPEHGGLGVEDWIGSAKPDPAAINAAITDAPWRPQAIILQRPESLDDLLGPVEDDKLRKPRTDKLTSAIELVLPLRFNQLTQRIENDGTAIDGDFLGTLYLQLAEKYFLEVAPNRAADAALVVARRNSFHPVRDYLNGLRTKLEPIDWEEIALKSFNNSSPWAQVLLQRQLIGLVARAMRPGCKLDTSLVIHSDAQGIGKSTFWTILGGEWFSDSLGDLRNLKDDILQLHSAWIHEWGEIDSVVGKRESETLKKFLSATKDDVRKPYGRGVETLQRSCGIVGTTNRSDFIKDPTGNRRFPVFSVESVNNDWVEKHRDEIWGSALSAFRAGSAWYFTQEETRQINAVAQEYSADDPLRDAIAAWTEDNPEIDKIPPIRAVWALRNQNQHWWDKRFEREFMRQVSLAMTAAGWTPIKGKRSRFLMPDGDRTPPATLWKRP